MDSNSTRLASQLWHFIGLACLNLAKLIGSGTVKLMILAPLARRSLNAIIAVLFPLTILPCNTGFCYLCQPDPDLKESDCLITTKPRRHLVLLCLRDHQDPTLSFLGNMMPH
ncbi:hypothetical protein IF1G_02252 [Cordyceps javanica]|uniref:Uncharacterized protein n=1 Tax=Cordyceps javanica TaxID=43265 RepID=A0A545VE91_9HYPO|nr:hypothetical protein IF1G_02252 [Cordyceps javanica]